MSEQTAKTKNDADVSRQVTAAFNCDCFCNVLNAIYTILTVCVHCAETDYCRVKQHYTPLPLFPAAGVSPVHMESLTPGNHVYAENATFLYHLNMGRADDI
jgi:hypothetical protein